MNNLNIELIKLSGVIGKQIDGLQELLKVVSNLVDSGQKDAQTGELIDMFGEGGAEEIKEENLEEELTGCCDASIVEQTGRCSKCLESV